MQRATLPNIRLFGNTQTVGAVDIQSIPVSCKNLEKLLGSFLNLLLCDAEVYNALVWVIEGTHHQHVKGSEKWISLSGRCNWRNIRLYL